MLRNGFLKDQSERIAVASAPNEKYLRHTKEFFDRPGCRTIVLARFVPMVRPAPLSSPRSGDCLIRRAPGIRALAGQVGSRRCLLKMKFRQPFTEAVAHDCRPELDDYDILDARHEHTDHEVLWHNRAKAGSPCTQRFIKITQLEGSRG